MNKAENIKAKYQDRIIFKQNIISVLSWWPAILVFTLWIIGTIVYSFLLNSLFEGQLVDALKDFKVMWFIKFVIDIIFISIMQIIIIYYLFAKQKSDGMHSLEIRFGVKTYRIYFLRYAINIVLMISMIFIIFILNIILFHSLGNIPTVIIWERIMPLYGFEFLYAIFIGALGLILFSFLKQAIASMITIFISLVISISPMLNMINYSAVSSNNNILKEMQKQSRVNAKFYYGNEFNKLLKNNKEYNWLVEVYKELGKDEYNKSLFQRAFLMGDFIGGKDSIGGFYNTITTNKDKYQQTNLLIKFESDLNEFVQKNKWEGSCSYYDVIFNTGNKRQSKETPYDINDCNLRSFSNFLIKNNFKNGMYNELFKYVAKVGDDIKIHNALSSNFAQGTNTTGGEVFRYAHTDNLRDAYYFGEYYNNPIIPEFMWMIVSNLRYSQSIDIEQIELINKNFPLNQKAKINLFINPFSQIQFMANGKNYQKLALDDVWNTSQNFITSFANNKIEFTKNAELDKLSFNNKNNDFRFKTINGSSELELLKPKLKQNASIEAMMIIYYVFSAILIYFSFFIYNKKIIY